MRRDLFFKKSCRLLVCNFTKKKIPTQEFFHEFFKNTCLVEHLTNSCFWREINEETQTFIWLKCSWRLTSFSRVLVPLELITSPFCVLGITFLDFFQGEKGVTFKFWGKIHLFYVSGIIFIDFFQGDKNVTFKFWGNIHLFCVSGIIFTDFFQVEKNVTFEFWEKIHLFCVSGIVFIDFFRAEKMWLLNFEEKVIYFLFQVLYLLIFVKVKKYEF